MQVALTPEQRRKLDARSKRERKSRSQIVRDALDAYLTSEPRSTFSREETQKVFDATFGSMPNLTVPPRSEWDERARRLGY